MNSSANKETYRERIVIPLRGDEDDSLRIEYSTMLQNPVSYTHLDVYKRQAHGGVCCGGSDVMEVVLVEPGKEARLAEIGSDLKSLQAAVGG